MDKDFGLQPPWPTLDVYKNASGELIIDVDVGQIVTGDLDLTLDGGRMLIKGKRRECETADGYLTREIRRGTFERAVEIPREFDLHAARAAYLNGMLRVTVPRKNGYGMLRVIVPRKNG